MTRYALCAVIFIVGLCAIVATGGKEIAYIAHPYKPATGPDAEKINHLLSKLGEAEWVVANPEDSFEEDVYASMASRIRSQLTAMGH